jgi:3-oxoacyl-(acyl-carrier-protein) synthase
VLGGNVNSRTTWSGQHDGAKPSAVQKCIKSALENAGIEADDAINGHLTATSKDSLEIQNWSEALERKGN